MYAFPKWTSGLQALKWEERKVGVYPDMCPASMLRVKTGAGEMEKPTKNKYHAVEESKANKVKLF